MHAEGPFVDEQLMNVNDVFLCTAAVSPTYLTAEQLPQEPGRFRVSWTPPASSANLTGYRMYYSGADDSGSVDVGASATNITMDNCLVGVTYTIILVAVSPHLPSPVVGPVSISLPGKYCAFMLHNGHGHLFAVLTVKLKVVASIVVVTVSKIVIKH